MPSEKFVNSMLARLDGHPTFVVAMRILRSGGSHRRRQSCSGERVIQEAGGLAIVDSLDE